MFLIKFLVFFTLTTGAAPGFDGSYNWHGLAYQPAIDKVLAERECKEFFSPSLLSDEAIAAIVNNGLISVHGFRAHDQSTNAINYLLTLKSPTQLQMARLWEQFALYIRANAKGAWDCARVLGKNGEIVYFGTAGHGIVINKDAVLYKGRVDWDSIQNEIWNSDYRHMGKVSEPIPR